MNLIKGKTYLTKSGKLVKLIWKLTRKDARATSYFVAIYAPYTEVERLIYYTENGINVDPNLHEMGGDSSSLDIVEEVDEEGKK